MNPPLQAIILLGGKGTRLHCLFPRQPKALVAVAGIPFLERQLAWLNGGGITDIHLATGHLAGAIHDWIQKRPNPNNTVTWTAEPSPLGTGGGLKFVEPYIRTNPFFVLNGDTLLPHLDFNVFCQAHEQTRPLASLAVTTIQETDRYGTVELDNQNHILAFNEKADRVKGWVNGGVYLMDKKMLSVIEPEKEVSLETELFPRWAAQGQLQAFPVPPPLLDMGTPEGLEAMERYFQSGSE